MVIDHEPPIVPSSAVCICDYSSGRIVFFLLRSVGVGMLPNLFRPHTRLCDDRIVHTKVGGRLLQRLGMGRGCTVFCFSLCWSLFLMSMIASRQVIKRRRVQNYISRNDSCSRQVVVISLNYRDFEFDWSAFV